MISFGSMLDLMVVIVIVILLLFIVGRSTFSVACGCRHFFLNLASHESGKEINQKVGKFEWPQATSPEKLRTQPLRVLVISHTARKKKKSVAHNNGESS